MRSDDQHAGSGTHVFRVAFICTGNRARSPFAAALLRRHVVDLPVAVSSFGTLDLGPAPALPKARRAARAYGVDLTSHRSRTLAVGDLAETDLALGFERIHIAAAVVVGGIPKERMFLLGELAELLAGVAESDTTDKDPWQLVELADAERIRRPLQVTPIADPVRSSERTFRTTFELIQRKVDLVARRLFGGIGPTASERAPDSTDEHMY